MKSESNILIKNYTDMIYSQGCVPVITQPTRITDTSSTLIDHIYTNNFIKEMKSYILLYYLTDHLPILVTTKFQIDSQKSVPSLIRDTKRFNAENFNNELLKNLYNKTDYCLSNVNMLMSNFINTFADTLEIHAPLRKQTQKEKKLKDKPWLTKGSLISIKQKNKLYKQCLNEQNAEQWKFYKKFRNKLTHIKELAKKLYFRK